MEENETKKSNSTRQQTDMANDWSNENYLKNTWLGLTHFPAVGASG